jgi:hypothetical protein
MRNTVIFTILIVLCSFAVTKRGSIDHIMQNLLQMNQQVGKEKSEIDILMAQVKSSLGNHFEKNEDRFGRFKQRCSQGIGLWKSFQEKIQLEKESYESKKEVEKEKKERAETDLQKFVVLEEELITKLKDTQKFIEEALAEYNKYASESDEKLNAVKVVKDTIKDDLLNNSKPSFVQLQTQTVSKKVENLKTILNEMSARESIYSSMLTTLLTVAQNSDFSDQELLKKILDILSKLEENIREFKTKQTVQLKQNVDLLKKTLQTQKDEAKINLERIKESKSIIEAEKENSKVIKQNIDEIEKTLNRKASEIEYWNKVCNYQEEMKSHDDVWKNETLEMIAKFLEQQY